MIIRKNILILGLIYSVLQDAAAGITPSAFRQFVKPLEEFFMAIVA